MIPTAVPSAFRAAHSSNHVPPLTITSATVPAPPANSLVRWDVDTGVFRSVDPNRPTTPLPIRPAFDAAMAGAGSLHNDSNRSAYFRFDGRQRFGNNTTSRSSVFAIWITIGYFEVDNNGHVGAELGWDTGEIRRNRGFFIVDRSIPAAVEPGVNHNIERIILVESLIE
jgi:hypothetical protein